MTSTLNYILVKYICGLPFLFRFSVVVGKMTIYTKSDNMHTTNAQIALDIPSQKIYMNSTKCPNNIIWW